MSEEIKDILNKFEKVLENYELDKKFKQFSVDSICHLFPNEMLTIKNTITYLQQKVEQLENIRKEAIKYVRKNQSAYVELLGNTIPIQELFTTNINLLNILNKGENKE